MAHGKKKSSGSGEVSTSGTPLGMVIVLAAAGGVVIGSAGTYFLTRPQTAPAPSAVPAVGGMPQAQTFTVPTLPAMTPQQQFTPAPQPPGEAPPGKVWSPEHGHWHDAPGALPIPAPVAVTPETTPAPVPATAVPTATPTPAPTAPPAEKKE